MHNNEYFLVIIWAAGLGQVFGYMLIHKERNRKWDAPMVVISLLIIFYVAYPNRVNFVGGVVLYALTSGTMPFYYFLKKIDDERAAKKKLAEINVKHDAE